MVTDLSPGCNPVAICRTCFTRATVFGFAADSEPASAYCWSRSTQPFRQANSRLDFNWPLLGGIQLLVRQRITSILGFRPKRPAVSVGKPGRFFARRRPLDTKDFNNRFNAELAAPCRLPSYVQHDEVRGPSASVHQGTARRLRVHKSPRRASFASRTARPARTLNSCVPSDCNRTQRRSHYRIYHIGIKRPNLLHRHQPVPSVR